MAKNMQKEKKWLLKELNGMVIEINMKVSQEDICRNLADLMRYYAKEFDKMAKRNKKQYESKYTNQRKNGS